MSNLVTDFVSSAASHFHLIAVWDGRLSTLRPADVAKLSNLEQQQHDQFQTAVFEGLWRLAKDTSCLYCKQLQLVAEEASSEVTRRRVFIGRMQ